MKQANTASQSLQIAVLVSWIAAVIGVWLWTTSYEFSTYATADAFDGEHWPEDANLNLADDRPTAVFFIHPRCPCTRASIRELEELLTGRGLSQEQQPELTVVATIPPNASNEWRDTDIIRKAARLPHATITWDTNGIETRHFGASTSGTVMVFAPSGARLFTGGVTASRGHEGDNAGSDRLWAILADRNPSPQESTPAFGCRLCGANSSRMSQTSVCEVSDSEAESAAGDLP